MGEACLLTAVMSSPGPGNGGRVESSPSYTLDRLLPLPCTALGEEKERRAWWWRGGLRGRLGLVFAPDYCPSGSEALPSAQRRGGGRRRKARREGSPLVPISAWARWRLGGASFRGEIAPAIPHPSNPLRQDWRGRQHVPSLLLCPSHVREKTVTESSDQACGMPVCQRSASLQARRHPVRSRRKATLLMTKWQ